MHEGISKRQSNHSSGTVMWLAYHRNVTALQLRIRVDQSDLSFEWPVGARNSARTEDSAQSHQTLFPSWGWGLGTRLGIKMRSAFIHKHLLFSMHGPLFLYIRLELKEFESNLKLCHKMFCLAYITNFLPAPLKNWPQYFSMKQIKGKFQVTHTKPQIGRKLVQNIEWSVL